MSWTRADRRWALLLLLCNAAIVVVLWHGVFRPFWYDESWRAYHITLTSGFWSELRTANAPMAGGWLAIERASATAFGNREGALRLPEVLSLAVFTLATFRLARWWLPVGWAGITALLASVNSSLLFNGLQLKAYLPEAACTSITILAWLHARRRRDERRAVWPMYLAMAACVVTSLPIVFLLAPLLLIDGITLLRQRDWRGLVPPVALGLLAFAHLQVFVQRQSYLAHDPFWDDLMLGSEGKGSVEHRLWTSIVSWPSGTGTAALTSPNGRPGAPLAQSPLLHPPVMPLHILIGVALVVAWIAGVWTCTRTRDGRALAITLGSAMLLIPIAAAFARWPLGFVRTNLFLVPLLYVVAAIGVFAIVERAKTHGEPAAKAAIAGAAIFAAAVAGTAVWRLGQLHGEQYHPTLLTEMRSIVENERRTAIPGDLFVLVTARHDAFEWAKPHQYYATLADSSRLPFPSPRSNTLALDAWDDNAVRDFVAAHPDAQHVFVTVYDTRRLDKLRPLAGYCATPLELLTKTFGTFRYDRCDSPIASGSP